MKQFKCTQYRFSLFVATLLLSLLVIACKKDAPLPPELTLTVKVNNVGHADSTFITLGSVVTFQWICRRGQADMDSLTIKPFDVFVGDTTYNGNLISSTGSFSTLFDSREIYADDIETTVDSSTTFYFTLNDKDGNSVTDSVWVGQK